MVLNTQSQTSTGIMDDFKALTMHNLNVNTSTITTFSNSKVKGSQYLFDAWTMGSVTTIDNNVYSKKYLFNLDKLTQNLYVKYTEQPDMIIILDKENIKNFSIGNQNYINAAPIDPKNKNVFYQVLVRDSSKLSLFKYTKTKFVKSDPTNIMNVQTGNFSDEYVDNPTYYIFYPNGELKKINLSESNIRKVLKDKSEKIDSFFNISPNREMDESLLISLVDYINL